MTIPTSREYLHDTEETLHSPLHRDAATEDVMAELETPLLPQRADEESSPHDSNNPGSVDLQEIFTPAKSWVGPSLLLFVSFLFATLNVSLRSLYTMPDPPSPSALSATRGWLIMTLFLPILIHRKSKTHREPEATISLSNVVDDSSLLEKSIWIVAIELACWNFLGQALYNCGILFVSSARASFLGQTTVVMVPLISALGGEKLRCWALWGCLCSLIGLILLSVQDNSPSGDHPQLSLGVGDMLILSSAVCWSFYLIKTSKYAHAYDEVYLQGTKNSLLAILYSGWFAAAWIHSDVSLWNGWHNGVAWAILIYSAAGPGVLADLIQQKGLESAGATESNLILCMESVFTAILGRVLLGEETSWIEKLGGAFLIGGAFVSGQ
jgi:drug/metabolite transporter (DMT)-like permease